MRNAYGLKADEWALIRPDGYVAALARTTDLGEVDKYLKQVGVDS